MKNSIGFDDNLVIESVFCRSYGCATTTKKRIKIYGKFRNNKT